jgi:hypothetical protein
LEANFLNGTKEGTTAKRPRRNWQEESERIAGRKRRRTIWRYTRRQTKIDTNSRKRTHKEAEDEEPMELRRKTS